MLADKVILYTPGHSLYTDTLIAYGLTHPIIGVLEDPEESLEVFGTGLNYIITISGLDLDSLAEAIAENIERRAEIIERELVFVPKSEAKTYADGRVGLFNEKDITSFIGTLKETAAIREFLESLQSPAHALEEGKTIAGRKAKSKLKLPLMPTAGKYLSQDLTTVNRFADNRYYRVCNYCAAFAALGLCCGALTAKWDKWALIITLGFEGKADGGAIKQAINLVEAEANALAGLSRGVKLSEIAQRPPLSIELGLSLDALPLRTLVQAMLCLFTDSAIRGLSESDASWKALSVKFDASKVKSGNLQVRGYEEILLDPVISALAELLRKSLIEDLRERILKLLRASRSRGPESGDAITALESLFTFFQTRRLADLYSFVRSFEVAMERLSKALKHKPSVSKKVCRELVILSRRA